MSNVDTAKAAYDAFSSGDMETLAGYFAEDATWESSDEVPTGGKFSGRDEIIASFGRLRDTWSDFSVSPEEFIDGGDKVVVRGTQRATGSGGQFESPYLHLMVFNDEGKLSHGLFAADSAKAVKALG